MFCFFPQSSTQKTKLPTVTIPYVPSSCVPQHLTGLTLQQQDSAQLKEVFLLYLTFLRNTRSASHNSAVPLTNAFIPLHTKKANYKIPVSKCNVLSKGSLLL